jgi:hypothetical protein
LSKKKIFERFTSRFFFNSECQMELQSEFHFFSTAPDGTEWVFFVRRCDYHCPNDVFAFFREILQRQGHSHTDLTILHTNTKFCVGPRPECRSPWSSNVESVLQSVGLGNTVVERYRLVLHRPTDIDPLTQSCFPLTDWPNPQVGNSVARIDDGVVPLERLETFALEHSLGKRSLVFVFTPEVVTLTLNPYRIEGLSFRTL